MKVFIAIRNDLKDLGFLFILPFCFLSSLFQECFQMVSDRSLSDFIAGNLDVRELKRALVGLHQYVEKALRIRGGRLLSFGL